MVDDVVSPATQSSAYVAMLDYWRMIDDILGGAGTMRAGGTKYLPKFQNETYLSKDGNGRDYDRYDERRRKAPFTNIYEDISTTLASKPFSKELTLKEGTPQQYLSLAEDIDGQGNNLHTFCADVFQTALDYSITWIFVDFSKAMLRLDGAPLSLAEEKQQGLRPYWVHVPPKRMLAAYSDFVNGEEILFSARMEESIVRTEEFREIVVERVREMWRPPITDIVTGAVIGYGPAVWRLWELVVGTKADEQTSWKVVDEGVFSLGEIPLVKVIPGRRKGMSYIVDPPLRNIAWKQIEEYQQESALQNIMELTCFPMLTANGMSAPDGPAPVGPQAVLYAPPTASGGIANWQVLEPAGTSIAKVMERLKDTQDTMRDLGRQPLTMQALTVVTTGQIAYKANSAVQAWALRFKDAVEQALILTAMWLNDRTYEPEVIIHLDYGPGLDGGEGFKGVLELRKNKDVSRETVIASAIRYGYLPDDFDMDKDEEELASEAEDLQPEMPIDPRTGLPLQQVPRPSGTGGQPPAKNGAGAAVN